MGTLLTNESQPCPEDNNLVEILLVSPPLAPVHAYSVGVSNAGSGWAILDRAPDWPRKGDVTW